MLDSHESQRSSSRIVTLNKSVSEEYTKRFLQDLFAQGAHFEDCIQGRFNVGPLVAWVGA
jgi:hypothetical protein